MRPYKEKYLAQAVRVRDTVTYSYQRGGASLLDFLNAEADYRSVQVNYLTSDRCLSHRRGSIESGGGPGSYSLNRSLFAIDLPPDESHCGFPR